MHHSSYSKMSLPNMQCRLVAKPTSASELSGGGLSLLSKNGEGPSDNGLKIDTRDVKRTIETNEVMIYQLEGRFTVLE